MDTDETPTLSSQIHRHRLWIPNVSTCINNTPGNTFCKRPGLELSQTSYTIYCRSTMCIDEKFWNVVGTPSTPIIGLNVHPFDSTLLPGFQCVDKFTGPVLSLSPSDRSLSSKIKK